MADIAELVARLRALALKFRNLGTFTGEYFHDIRSGIIFEANRLVEEIYDAGFLLSIEGMSEVRNRIETSKYFSLTKISLFDIIVGFTRNPEPTMIEEVWADENGERDVLNEYWFVEPGLLKQSAIHVKDWRPAEQADFLKRHGFDLCDRNARGCEMLIEVIEREMAAQKPIQQADDGEDGKRVREPRLSVNARMLEYFRKNPQAVDYSVTKWEEVLGCSRSTIHATQTWKLLMRLRKANGLEMLERQSNAASDKSNAPGKSKKIKPKDLQ